MMQRLKKIFILILVGLGFCAPVSFAQIDLQEDMGIGQAAVQKIFDIYRDYSKDGFEALVSEDFIPVRSEFMNMVDTNAAAEQAVEFDFSISQVLILNKKMAVMLRWYKKFTTSAIAGQQQSQGDSELIFSLEGEQWNFVTINGDNPF